MRREVAAKFLLIKENVVGMSIAQANNVPCAKGVDRLHGWIFINESMFRCLTGSGCRKDLDEFR